MSFLFFFLLVQWGHSGMWRRTNQQKTTMPSHIYIYIYISQLLCKTLWTFYGVLDPNGLLIVTVNSVGVLSQLVYILIYIIYAPHDKKVAVVKTKSVEYMPFFLSFFLVHFWSAPQKLFYYCAKCCWTSIRLSTNFNLHRDNEAEGKMRYRRSISLPADVPTIERQYSLKILTRATSAYILVP